MLLITPFAQSGGFTVGNVDGLYNLRLSYGALFRLRDRDQDLIAQTSGGNARSANIDDGNLNYGEGLVSNMFRATGELALRAGAFGMYMRGAAFYDFENKNNNPDRTDFNSNAEKLVGSDVELRESYLNWSDAPGGIPMTVRLGQQIINWGETTFVRNGIDVINPADLVTAFQPASALEDFRTPQRMLWAAANITETFSFEAYYQYEWEEVDLPPVGWYFSNNDTLGSEGLNAWMYGNGAISDLGTNLDDEFALPPGTLGFDPDYQRLDGINRDRPSDTGQYGVALIGVFPGRNAIKAGVHYMRYHSRLPLLMGRTGDAAAVAATAEPFVDARAQSLAAVYLSEGLPPDEAASRGRQAAESLTLSTYANEASFTAAYPEDIDALGMSFSTATTGTGTLLAGEFSYHSDYPFQIAPTPLFNAVFSPVLFDPDVGDTLLGDFGPSQTIGGFERLDRMQASLEAAQVFRGRLWADQILLSADIAWVGIEDLPGAGEPPLTSSDENSWGYRLQAAAQYSGLFGGVNLFPFAAFSHDVNGTTPGPLSTFVEDRKAVVVGLRATYINRISAELRYTGFFHGGRTNQLRDRDFMRLQLSYYL